MASRQNQHSPSSYDQEHQPLEQNERWASLAIGGALLAWITPRSVLRFLALPSLGGYLVYRGVTGRCPITDATGTSLSKIADKLTEFGSAASDSVYRNPYDEPGTAQSHRIEDPVDEASMESFPASDPPSFSPQGDKTKGDSKEEKSKGGKPAKANSPA